MKFKCKQCRKEFITDDRRRKYCSSKCYHTAQIRRIEKTCEFCGKVFFTIPYWEKRGKGKYCSIKCKCEARKIKKVRRVCKTCGKVFYVLPHFLESGRGIYCSKSCASSGKVAWNKNLTKETDPRVARYAESGAKTRTGVPLSKKHVEAVTRSITGLTRSDEAKKNYRLSKLGDKNPNWKGGTSEIAYPEEWNAKLRELVRFRDNYQCQLCGCPESENERRLDVHHINYDKKNCSPDNLISLCAPCHVRTRYSRLEWQKFFEERIVTIMDSKMTKFRKVKKVSDKPKLIKRVKHFDKTEIRGV